jgi:putative DNA modification/repair radical SAM protein
MEQMIEVTRCLREDHDFRGYIHLKTIPEADPALVERAGLWADRVSINVELPTDSGLALLAPDKNRKQIEGAIAHIGDAITEASDARKRFRHAPRFAPAGQSTQMIVGADGASDRQIIGRANSLYDRFRLRRVYYSAFSPIPDASAVLPLKRPPLIREHRLYQSDWLVRFYGFAASEVQQATGADGMLPLDIDPKLAWALQHRAHFPIDINRAPREMLLRVPGLGTRAVAAIIQARRHHRLRLDDLGRLTRSVSRLRPFIIAADWRPTGLIDRLDLQSRLAPPRQMELFG